MKHRKEDEDEISRQARDDEGEEVEELSEKEVKKKKQKESAEKRKNARKKDKVARWGGIILLGLIMFVGFLLWIFGEMGQEITPLNQKNITPISTPFESRNGSVIVK